MTATVVDTPPQSRRLIMLDTAYSLATLRSRRLLGMVTSRDIDGFFDHVWSVHPLVGASPEHDPDSAVGPPGSTDLGPRHTMVEGRVGRLRALQRLPVVNLLLAQAELAWVLHGIIRKNAVSAIEANDPYYTGMTGLLLARAHRLPLIVTVVENFDRSYAETGRVVYPRLFRRRSVEKRVERTVFSHADLVVVGSWDNHRYATANGAPPERIAMFKFGDLVHPTHHDDPRERRSIRADLAIGDRRFLIYVGRLEPVKLPGDVLMTLSKVRRHHPDVMAVIVGDGSIRPELETQAAALGLGDDVVFAGNRDQMWIASALSEAAVVVSPLTGRALVEASLSGTPIVAYDAEWQPEFIESGTTGLIVAFRDTDAMAAAVDRLLNDDNLATRLAHAARAKTITGWDPQANKAERRDTLARVIDTGTGRRKRRRLW